MDLYLDELRLLNNELTSKNQKLAIISGIPYLKFNPIICSQWFAKLNNHCTSIWDESSNTEIKMINKKLEGLNDEGIIFINIYDEIVNQIKSKNKNPIDLYRSEDHLSANGALLIKDVILKKLSIKNLHFSPNSQ